MRYLLGFVLVLLTLGTLRVLGCGDVQEERVGGPVDQVACSRFSPCTVWLLGDSNTVAMGESFAAIDLTHAEYTTVNLGRNGESAASAVGYVESLLTAMAAPDIAVVTYGGMDILEDYATAPPDATAPTSETVDEIYASLEAICALLESEGSYSVLGQSIGALTELHPGDTQFPPNAIDFAALGYLDQGYVLLGDAIEARYAPGWVNFRMPKDFELWSHGSLLAYAHLTDAGYAVMSSRLEAKLDDLIVISDESPP